MFNRTSIAPEKYTASSSQKKCKVLNISKNLGSTSCTSLYPIAFYLKRFCINNLILFHRNVLVDNVVRVSSKSLHNIK